MDYRKLFHVLVVGGALAGAASGCGDDTKKDPPSAQNTGDAGTTDGGTSTDGGTDPDPGGGVEGW
jgi:hypothetical protein